jgi:signal transduction histidine kinase
MVSAMIVPLVARGRTIGAITFVSAESGRRFDDADLVLAEDLAGRCALAVDNARLYREARTAVRDRDEFLSMAAHELRTPVTGVKGYAQLLRRGEARNDLDPDRRARYLEDIAAAADRLARLSDDLLDVSRLRLGYLPLRPRPVDIAALVRRAIARWRDLAGDPRPLDLSLPEGLLTAVIDPDRVEQVLVHLLENAARYSPDLAPVRVEAVAERHGVCFGVRDEGMGLPQGTGDAIFEPFGRGANAAARGLPGLGLGLFICRGIVERHGGRIWAESAGEGRGASFSFWLPAARPPGEPDSHPTPD